MAERSRKSTPDEGGLKEVDSWIWIVLIGGLFWFMHRSGMGCCGGHGGHRDHEDDHHRGDASDRPQDKERDKAATRGGCH